MSNYIQEAFLRVEEMVQEALNSTLGYDIDVRLWPHQQEVKPYITLRLGTMNADTSSFDEWIQANVHTVLVRLVTGHLTEGKVDEPQDDTHVYIVLIEDYLRKHPTLTTDAGTYADDGADYLLVSNDQFLVGLVSHTGLVIFLNTGLAHQEVGCEFTLRLPYLRDALP